MSKKSGIEAEKFRIRDKDPAKPDPQVWLPVPDVSDLFHGNDSIAGLTKMTDVLRQPAHKDEHHQEIQYRNSFFLFIAKIPRKKMGHH